MSVASATACRLTDQNTGPFPACPLPLLMLGPEALCVWCVRMVSLAYGWRRGWNARSIALDSVNLTDYDGARPPNRLHGRFDAKSFRLIVSGEPRIRFAHRFEKEAIKKRKTKERRRKKRKKKKLEEPMPRPSVYECCFCDFRFTIGHSIWYLQLRALSAAQFLLKT